MDINNPEESNESSSNVLHMKHDDEETYFIDAIATGEEGEPPEAAISAEQDNDVANTIHKSGSSKCIWTSCNRTNVREFFNNLTSAYMKFPAGCTLKIGC